MFHKTVASVKKLLPLTNNVNAGLPTVVLIGEMLLILGAVVFIGGVAVAVGNIVAVAVRVLVVVGNGVGVLVGWGVGGSWVGERAAKIGEIGLVVWKLAIAKLVFAKAPDAPNGARYPAR